MKKQLNLLFLVLILTTGLYAQSFEGLIKIKSDSPYGINADFTVKGSLVMIENGSKHGQVKMIFDKSTGDMTTISDENGKTMAVRMNNDQNPYLNNQNAKSTTGYEDFSIEKTTDTKVINGYNCTRYIGKNRATEAQAWITDELDITWADLVQFKKGAGRNPYQMGFGQDGMIMEMQVKETKINKEWTMTTEVTEQPVADSQFEVPNGVELMDLSDMRQLMMEAQKDPEKLKQLKEIMQKN